ncbi:MAG: sigma-70 family RNA polymerase sigma factor [Candidatus Coatesbacteria bacterium]|nr:MAG: sigma-70 family RNA polymerase sigma factor [Candidatus Coatesbacteria bacterium]
MATESVEGTEEEEAVVARAKRGDEDAYAWLLDRYNAAIYTYCRRLVRGEDARDLAQETFVKAFLSIGTFDETKRFAPWLYRIAHNLVIDYLRKKRAPTYSLTIEDDGEAREFEFADRTLAPEELVSRKEIREAFNAALESLETEYKEVLVLRHVEGFSYDEIAGILGLPLGTVKVRIHRGRQRLKQKLRPYV